MLKGLRTDEIDWCGAAVFQTSHYGISALYGSCRVKESLTQRSRDGGLVLVSQQCFFFFYSGIILTAFSSGAGEGLEGSLSSHLRLSRTTIG